MSFLIIPAFLSYATNGPGVQTQYRSCGMEIYFDTKWWNELPLSLGIRYSRLLDPDYEGRGPNQWELILPLNLLDKGYSHRNTKPVESSVSSPQNFLILRAPAEQLSGGSFSMKYTSEIEKRRTFAIISHPDAGKTTLTEKFLLFGGAIQTAGAVKSNKIRKHATSDFMEIERQRGISVATSVMSFRIPEHADQPAGYAGT